MQGTDFQKSLAYLRDPEIAEDFIERLGSQVLYVVEASVFKPFNRYNLRPGRIFGKKNDPKTRYRISELAGHVVVIKNLETGRNQYYDLDSLIDWWNDEKYVEITHLDEILETIRKYLTPFLGTVLITALINWLMGRLK